MRKRITLSLDENLTDKIDDARGDIPRSRYVESLLLCAFSAAVADEEAEVGGYA